MNKFKGIMRDGELYISANDVIEHIKHEMDVNSRRPGKTESEFAKKMIKTLKKLLDQSK